MGTIAVARSRRDFAELRRWAYGHDPSMVEMVVLVSCSDAKAAHACEARHLYTSQLFRQSMRLAERLGDRVGILSAKHGLVAPTRHLEPYDHRLTAAGADLWAHFVVNDLEAHAAAQLGSPVVVPVILAGARYADPIRRQILSRGKSTPVLAPRCPLEGLEVGERLAMLTYQLGVLPTKRGAA